MEEPKPAQTPAPRHFDYRAWVTKTLDETIAAYPGIGEERRHSPEFRAEVAAEAVALLYSSADSGLSEFMADAFSRPAEQRLSYLATVLAKQCLTIAALKEALAEARWKSSIPPAL